MPDLSGPFDGSTFAQAQYFRDRGPLEVSGVVGPPQTAAGSGELGLTAAGFGLTLALGRAHVRGAAYERTGTAWTDTVPANSSGVGPRNDLVVLRRDLTAKTVVPVRLQGTAAATPADPAITQAENGVWDLPLFRVQAPPSSGTPLVITDLRPWIDPGAGALVGGWVNLPLVGGAILAHDATLPVQYRREGSRVALRGWSTSTGGFAAGTALSTALADTTLRPALDTQLWTPREPTGGAQATLLRAVMQASGVLTTAGTAGAVAANSWVNFDGVSWPLG